MFDDWSPNPTSTSLAIWAGVKDGGKKYIGAKCLLDSGCQDNWISVGVLKRGEILADMKPLSGQGDTKFVGFNGDVARPLGIITITWFMKSAATARDTDFLVAEKGPYDVLLGRRFILSESVITVNEAALPLRGPRITTAEQAQIDANERRQQAESEQLVAAQRERELAARAQLRQQSEADSTSSSAITPTTTGTGQSGSDGCGI